MARVARVVQTPIFRKKVKKLTANQKKDLVAKQLTLLGYSYDDGNLVLELLALGSHENFYRDVKNTFGN